MIRHAPETSSTEYKNTTIQSKTVWQRIAITAAGPVANLILAVILYAVIAWIGTVEPVAILAQPKADTPAATAGFQAHGRAQSVDENPLSTWLDFRWTMLDKVHKTAPVEITVTSQDGSAQTRELNNPHIRLDRVGEIDPIEELGFILFMLSLSFKPMIAAQNEEQAGTLKGDDIFG